MRCIRQPTPRVRTAKVTGRTGRSPSCRHALSGRRWLTCCASHAQTYTAALSTFFKRLDLSHVYGILSWNDVENPAAGSPDVNLQTARITNAPGSVLYWELMVRGDRSKVMVPFLPPQAPGGLNVGATYGWEQLAFGLDFNLASFDFDDFAFSEITQHGSHMAIDSTQITWPRRKYAPRGPSIHK